MQKLGKKRLNGVKPELAENRQTKMLKVEIRRKTNRA